MHILYVLRNKQWGWQMVLVARLILVLMLGSTLVNSCPIQWMLFRRSPKVQLTQLGCWKKHTQVQRLRVPLHHASKHLLIRVFMLLIWGTAVLWWSVMGVPYSIPLCSNIISMSSIG